MKVMKIALLGTAALAAVSVSARADALADLKAQIEALNSRISQLEAAPAVPAGYQLLSVSDAPAIVIPSLEIDKGFGPTATTIGILPTADVPASTTIQWSGYARAGLVYAKDKWSYSSAGLNAQATAGADTSYLPETSDDLDIYARGQLKVVGTTDTAVGEVGAMIQFRGNFDGHSGGTLFINDDAWGWWKMTPELTLGGGYTDTLANIGYGYDGACNCYYTDNAPVALNPGDTTQIRLSYASGPLSFAIALEDASQNVRVAEPWLSTTYATTYGVAADGLGAAGEIKYAGDMFSAEVSAGWWDTSGTALGAPFTSATDSTDDSWQVGAGLGFSLDPIAVSLAAGTGQFANGSDYWKASILVSATLSDAVHAEVAYGYANTDGFVQPSGLASAYDTKTNAFLAGIYYDPVSQLTIGLEGEWYQVKGSGYATTFAVTGTDSIKKTSTQVDLVTIFRF